MYTCDLTQSSPVNIAVAEIRAPMMEVPSHIPTLLEKVAGYLTDNGYAPGLCYVVYDDFAAGTMRMRAGFTIADEAVESDDISVMNLEATTTAHTVHYGPYDGIPAAHQAVREFCTNNNHSQQDLSWEIYTEWHEDESKLVTDVHVAIE